MTGGGCLTSTEGSVSPFVWTISVGPLAALFSMMGIRSRRAGLRSGHKHRVRGGDKIFEQIHSVEMWSSCYERGLGPDKREKKNTTGRRFFKVDVKNEKMKFCE